MPRLYAFDFEDTLIGTQLAIRQAYAAIGLRHDPGYPWEEWCTKKQHDLMVSELRSTLPKYGRLLPLAAYASIMKAPVLASETSEVVKFACGLFKIDLKLACSSATQVAKAETLCRIKHYAGAYECVYVDDNPRHCDFISALGGWKMMTPADAIKTLL